MGCLTGPDENHLLTVFLSSKEKIIVGGNGGMRKKRDDKNI